MTIDEARHLQRRLVFAATTSTALRGLSVDAAFNALVSASRMAGAPASSAA
jgi:hypothetical protein